MDSKIILLYKWLLWHFRFFTWSVKTGVPAGKHIGPIGIGIRGIGGIGGETGGNPKYIAKIKLLLPLSSSKMISVPPIRTLPLVCIATE